MADGLFQDFDPLNQIAANQYGPSVKKISRGTLVAFHYPISFAQRRPNIIHDPYPMVIITDVWPTFIRGVNLHYLTFPFIKKILSSHCDNTGFSYATIKSDKYVAGAFRMYNRKGMHRVKKMDCEWLLRVLKAVRSFSESELQKLQDQIQSQIQSRLQAKAEELTSYEDFRNSLLKGEQNTLDRKVDNIRDAIQGGVDRDIIHPDIDSI